MRDREIKGLRNVGDPSAYRLLNSFADVQHVELYPNRAENVCPDVSKALLFQEQNNVFLELS
jgi:hypothetical protein